MRRKLYIPYEVKESIRKHIKIATEKAVDGYFSANEDEDTMTGQLGILLKCKTRKVRVVQSEISGYWKWSIDYHKFRGHGPGATESHLGADGVFELKLYMGSRTDKKSILFQAKLDWKRNARILEQCIKLSTWREAAFLLNFTQSGFEAFSIDDVLLSRGVKPDVSKASQFADFFSGKFIECIVGDTDMYYDARSRKLIWRTMDGEIVATRFPLKQRVSLNVIAPTYGFDSPQRIDREISNEEIHKYRMNATPEEMLSLGVDYTNRQIREAKKLKALAYHPDKFGMLDDAFLQILNRRMQEFNIMVDLVKKRRQEIHG